MVTRRRSEPEEALPPRRPATTPDARENQLIRAAVDLAEKQLRDGTASAQVISHYLKMSSSRERLEQKKLDQENKLLEAKAEAIASAQRVEELYKKALDSMRAYSGFAPETVDDEYDDD